MLYVSQETKFDVSEAYDWMEPGRAGEPAHNIVLKDTADDEFSLTCSNFSIQRELQALATTMQSVAGLYVMEDTFVITPLSSAEVSVLKLLSNPHFHIRDKVYDKGAKAYACSGLYNFAADSGWGRVEESKVCNIAKLLLETCGSARDDYTGGQRIETTPEYIAVMVDNSQYQSVFLRFDIEDYQKVTRAYTKYKLFRDNLKAAQYRVVKLKTED